jgi:hypothetical protein
MATLADLHRSVQTAIASKRVGRPVFVRYTFQGLEQPDAVVPKLANAAAAVREWIGQPLERVQAVGNVESGQVALTLQFRDGATALVSFARTPPRGDGVDLMVLGNHGTIYHDAGSAELWDEPAAGGAEPADATLQALIERALRSGRPEPAAGATP